MYVLLPRYRTTVLPVWIWLAANQVVGLQVGLRLGL